MSKKSEKPIVIKIGGSTFGSHDTTIEDIVYLQKQGRRLVVVHGGANLVSEWLVKQGITSAFVRGERVTDETALKMVTAVLGGLVNKEIVGTINNQGGRAVGISGVDGALLQGRVRDKEMGYVGDIARVNPAVLEALLAAGFIPVITPVSLYSIDRPENAPPMLNTNGDTAAGEIAAAIDAEAVVFLTDVDGVNDKSGKLIPSMTAAEAESLINSGVASGGMIPKVKACLKALSNTSAVCIINGKKPHALRQQIEGKGGGTVIKRS